MGLKPKILSLTDALKLADILCRYVDDVPNRPLNLIKSLLSKMKSNPKDYLHCVMILSGLSEMQIRDQNPSDISNVFTFGILSNGVVDMCRVMKKLGLVRND